jgi:hypothetical protein
VLQLNSVGFRAELLAKSDDSGQQLPDEIDR